MLNKDDQNSTTAPGSEDDSEVLDEVLIQDMETSEKKRVIHQSDVVQEGIAGEVKQELGTSHVEDILAQAGQDLHPGHIADIFRHEHPDWDGDDPFAGITDDGQEGVKAFRKGSGGFDEDFDEEDLEEIFDESDDPSEEVMLDQVIVEGVEEFKQHEQDERHTKEHQNPDHDDSNMGGEEDIEFVS